jgi:nitrite reductase/ring-hydroxylating ferredoxin subunit
MDQVQRAGRRIAVCRVGELTDGEATQVPAEQTGTGAAIAVFNDGDRFYALNDRCPHAAASLAEGWVADGTVECPRHGSVFDLRTGAVLSMPATEDAVTHRIEMADDTVWLLAGTDAGD